MGVLNTKMLFVYRKNQGEITYRKDIIMKISGSFCPLHGVNLGCDSDSVSGERSVTRSGLGPLNISTALRKKKGKKVLKRLSVNFST